MERQPAHGRAVGVHAEDGAKLRRGGLGGRPRRARVEDHRVVADAGGFRDRDRGRDLDGRAEGHADGARDVGRDAPPLGRAQPEVEGLGGVAAVDETEDQVDAVTGAERRYLGGAEREHLAPEWHADRDRLDDRGTPRGAELDIREVELSCPRVARDPECQDEGAGGAARDGEHAGQHPDDARAIQRLDDVRDLGEVAQRLRDGDLHGDDRARLGLDDDGGEAHRVVRGGGGGERRRREQERDEPRTARRTRHGAATTSCNCTRNCVAAVGGVVAQLSR
jgi:hypothetical protein